jgi:predicted Zn-dependent protease with MMP-like domain
MVKLSMRYRAALIQKELRRRQFERIVERAVASLGEDLQMRLDNVEIVVAMEPDADQAAESGDQLFGLYEGIPLTERTGSYGMTLPDKITIFQGPLERNFTATTGLYEQIRVTVLHEIAHHFGIDEARLADLGYE